MTQRKIFVTNRYSGCIFFLTKSVFTQTNAFVSCLVALSQPFVLIVLSMVAFSYVVFLTIKSISVFMINFYSRIGYIHYKPMKQYRSLLIFVFHVSSGIKSFLTLNGKPLPLIKKLKIFVINQCHLALCELDLLHVFSNRNRPLNSGRSRTEQAKFTDCLAVLLQPCCKSIIAQEVCLA